MAEVASSVKLVLIGDSGVGKTCLVHRYAYDSFPEGVGPTIGGACLRVWGGTLSRARRVARQAGSASNPCPGAATAGAFVSKDVQVERTTVKFQIWDTAGQGERVRRRAAASWKR